MGVIRNSSVSNSFDNQQLIEDILDNIPDHGDDNLQQHNLNEQNEERIRIEQQRQRQRRVKKYHGVRPQPTYRCLGIRGKSYKKHRRFENANLLSREYGHLSDGEELNEIMIYDFIPQTVSAFAQLLMEKENMNAWNKIINCTEEEQDKFLAENDNEKDVKEEEKLDNRKKEPSYSADECFKRIDADLKNMLKKKHLPLGVLATIEEEITNFFSDKPFDVYSSFLPSGYQRLLLHACCQYLDLACQSFNKDGERWSKVENQNDYFGKPTMMLAKYLEMKAKKESKRR